MKSIFFPLLVMASITAHSQIEYVDTDWVIDQTEVMADGISDTLQLDVDQDGVVDMRITSWSNHQGGIPTVVEVLMPDAVGFGGLQVSQSNAYIQDCPSTGFTYQSINGYIYTSDSPNPYANQYVKMPFRFEGSAGVHYGLLYVRYVGSTITIEGYAWNQTVNAPCDCNSTQWLSLNEHEINKSKGDFKYYNMMGQQVDSLSGLMIKVYDSGLVERVYVVQ